MDTAGADTAGQRTGRHRVTPSNARVTSFAIVIPTYNEGADIGPTCEALLALDPPADELIFVDGASTDDTPDVIRRHLVRPSMRLIMQDAKRGISAGRNAGIRAASSDVVVFVDADVLLPRDFLRRIARHYENGADAVGVEAEVPNTHSVYGRFLQAEHEFLFRRDEDVTWTQAFSCRREVALQAGLFPDELPLGAEDTEFVRRLDRRTDRRLMDRTIVVRHVTPSTMHDFWNQWQHRGASLPFLRHRIHHVSLSMLVAERMAAACWSLVFVLTVVPVAHRAASMASFSQRRWFDLPAFLALNVLQLVAHRVGEWRGLVRLSLAPAAHHG